MDALILVCAAGMAAADCTPASADRVEIITRAMTVQECLLESEASQAAKPDLGLNGGYLKIICGGLP